MHPETRREDIRHVAVILAGSRTGSSFLFSALKAQGEFISPTGEETPFYRLAGLGRFDGPSYSDAIKGNIGPQVLDHAFDLLATDLGIGQSHCEDRRRLAESFLTRLALQWPDAVTSANKSDLKAELISQLNQFPADWTGWSSFYLQWIAQLEAKGLPVSPALYSASEIYNGKPPLLEEPPYIIPEPKLPLTPKAARTTPLLLKTSTNIYRTEFLRALFPRAQFKWILLRRNPAASISALMDGWLSGGFHAHDVHPHCTLKIKDYSDVVAGGDRYWKFDMPPGWREFTGRPLEEVCAFQWLSAYQTMQNFCAGTGDPTFSVAYEDLISTAAPGVFRELIRFTGATEKSAAWDARRPVATVAPPALGKWKKRSAQIIPFLREHRGGLLLEMADKYHYDRSQLEAWP